MRTQKRRLTFCLILNCYSLPDSSGPFAQIGREVSGDGGRWLPHVVEVQPGRYVAAICEIAPGVQVVAFDPIWTDWHFAAHQAAKMAEIAAA